MSIHWRIIPPLSLSGGKVKPRSLVGPSNNTITTTQCKKSLSETKKWINCSNPNLNLNNAQQSRHRLQQLKKSSERKEKKCAKTRRKSKTKIRDSGQLKVKFITNSQRSDYVRVLVVNCWWTEEEGNQSVRRGPKNVANKLRSYRKSNGAVPQDYSRFANAQNQRCELKKPCRHHILHPISSYLSLTNRLLLLVLLLS